jgi:hypothetical protein
VQPYSKHPDLLPEVLDHLKTLLPTYTFAEDLTGWEAPEQRITIQPSGGTISRIRTASPRYDVNVYGPSKPGAFSISMDVIKAVLQMRNYTGSNFVITDVQCSYPADISDPLNYNPTWVFDITFSYRTRL